ncbi:hypothetical protein [Ruegeria profundi]|uniref:hypothetical protein n=1 Tax=Ruegeria profundi TaxID=1685378 RepID=UPI003C7EA4C1
MSERKMRGILDTGQSDHDNFEQQWEEPSENYVPGMGTGATRQAIRWAYIGYCVEREHFIQCALTNPKGRPAKDPLASKDAYRAFLLWKMVNQTIGGTKLNCSIGTLVSMAIAVEERLNLPMQARAFPPSGSYASSISRGKKILEIDSDWNSEICEKIDAI